MLIDNPFVLIKESYEMAGKDIEEDLGYVGLLRNSLFNTSPQYFDISSTGTIVDYYIQFSSNPCTIVSISTIEGYTETPLEITRSELVLGDEDYYLGATLPQKISYYDSAFIYHPYLYVDSEIPKAWGISKPSLSEVYENASEEEKDALNNATYLLTRYDSSTDLTQLLFVSDGNKMAMPADVFKREIEKIFIPPEYDFNNTNPQFTGWGGLFTNDFVSLRSNVYEYDSKNILSTRKIHEYTVDEFWLLLNTRTPSWDSANPNFEFNGFSTTEYFEPFTAPPAIYFSTNPSNVYTHYDESGNIVGTCPEYLTVDFEGLINTEITINDLRSVEPLHPPNQGSTSKTPAYFLFMYDDEYIPTALINATSLQTKRERVGNTYIYEPEIAPKDLETMSNISVKMNLHWTNLIII